MFWSLMAAATLFHPSPILSECACNFAERLVRGNLRFWTICAIFGQSFTWSVEANPEQTCCSSSFPTIGNRCLTMERGLFSILGMLGCFYLGLLYLSISVEIDIFCSMALGPVIPFTACKNYFYDHQYAIYRLQKEFHLLTCMVLSSVNAKFQYRIFGSRYSHLLKSVSRLDVLATYLKWWIQFISSFLIENFSSSEIFEILTSNFGYSNPSPIGLQFFCRAFGYLLKMMDLIFSWIKDALLSVSVDISITHLWFGRGETRASPISSMQCLDMLRKSISNLFWVNWLNFGRDLSPAFSILISCWHWSIIRFPPAKKRLSASDPPILWNFQQCFSDLKKLYMTKSATADRLASTAGLESIVFMVKFVRTWCFLPVFGWFWSLPAALFSRDWCSAESKSLRGSSRDIRGNFWSHPHQVLSIFACVPWLCICISVCPFMTMCGGFSACSSLTIESSYVVIDAWGYFLRCYVFPSPAVTILWWSTMLFLGVFFGLIWGYYSWPFHTHSRLYFDSPGSVDGSAWEKKAGRG